MKLLRPFTAHPDSIGETYGEHLRHASGFGARMVLAGAACLVHAILPFLFVRTATEVVTDLHERMLVRCVAPSKSLAGESSAGREQSRCEK